jgi:hypothetical protein
MGRVEAKQCVGKAIAVVIRKYVMDSGVMSSSGPNIFHEGEE